MRNHRGNGLLWARAWAAAAVLTGVSLLAAACGGGPTHDTVASLGHGKTTSTTAAPSQGAAGSAKDRAQALQYAQCMRAHGVPNFPDPSIGPNGGYGFKITPANHLDTGSPQFLAADKTCRKLLPNGGRMTAAEQAKAMAQALKFSQCMRTHGVPSFPDPQAVNGGISVRLGPGANPSSPQFQAAQKACRALMPGGGP